MARCRPAGEEDAARRAEAEKGLAGLASLAASSRGALAPALRRRRQRGCKEARSAKLEAGEGVGSALGAAKARSGEEPLGSRGSWRWRRLGQEPGAGARGVGRGPCGELERRARVQWGQLAWPGQMCSGLSEGDSHRGA